MTAMQNTEGPGWGEAGTAQPEGKLTTPNALQLAGLLARDVELEWEDKGREH
jgi:hypothetical protein